MTCLYFQPLALSAHCWWHNQLRLLWFNLKVVVFFGHELLYQLYCRTERLPARGGQERLLSPLLLRGVRMCAEAANSWAKLTVIMYSFSRTEHAPSQRIICVIWIVDRWIIDCVCACVSLLSLYDSDFCARGFSATDSLCFQEEYLRPFCSVSLRSIREQFTQFRWGLSVTDCV